MSKLYITPRFIWGRKMTDKIKTPLEFSGDKGFIRMYLFLKCYKHMNGQLLQS